MKQTTSFRLVAAALLTFSASSQAATLLSENFDALTTGLTVTSAGAFSTIGGTNVDIVGASNGFGALCAAPESGNCVDLGGSDGDNPQGILQSNVAFLLSPGTNYYLSFDLVGSGRGLEDSTEVTFASYDQTFNLGSGDVTNGVVSNALITVATAGSYFLTFTNETPGNVGSLLDDVSITSSPAAASATPEPSTLLLTVPFLLAGYLRRRKSR